METDSLDDDAFFASLREAVRDDATYDADESERPVLYDDEADDRRRFRRRR